MEMEVKEGAGSCGGTGQRGGIGEDTEWGES